MDAPAPQRDASAAELVVETPGAPRDAGREAPALDAERRDPTQSEPIQGLEFRLATWNLGVFGPTKAARREDVAKIAEIIGAYELVAVQEIKDISGGAAQVLKRAVESDLSAPYATLVSGRSGVQADDTVASQEQYAFIFRSDLFEVTEPPPRLFPDHDNDYFQREPFVAKFRLSGATDAAFVVVNVHTAPGAAADELQALHHVVSWAAAEYGETDVIVLGDFNAACDYVSPEQLGDLELRADQFQWLIPDEADTNHFEPTSCAYDRVVLTSHTLDWLSFSGWGVDRPFEDRRISDHWPVWVRFSVSGR
ncbi:MAG: hypothetical protein RJA70_958 [Pseudomonadota bacterium]|jgi:endonuclease/exonuclease/phosphatase family metal-dependent hydrolase